MFRQCLIFFFVQPTNAMIDEREGQIVYATAHTRTSPSPPPEASKPSVRGERYAVHSFRITLQHVQESPVLHPLQKHPLVISARGEQLPIRRERHALHSIPVPL